MYEDKINALRDITGGRLTELEAKKILLETLYLRPGNSGAKWPSLYGPFRFWFSQDAQRKVHLEHDPNASRESVLIWNQLGLELYGNRFIDRGS